MADRDRIQVEMSPGQQPPTALGDRLMVGLALLALVGGLVIAVGNFLPDETDVAQSTPQPSIRLRTAEPTPTARPPRVAIVEQPESEIRPVDASPGYTGWIRANVDLAIHATPDANAAETGVLPAGEIAFTAQQAEPAVGRGWLYLQLPQAGWIMSVNGATQLVQRYTYSEPPYSGHFTALAAGPNGFLALLHPPSEPRNYPSTLPAVSTDGEDWREGQSPAFSGWGMISAAWGPSGWLGVTFASDGSRNQIWLWNSQDGLRWIRLGVLGGIDEYPGQMLGSELGYLLQTSSQIEGGTSLWSTADGLRWTESLDPVIRLFEYRGPQTAAVPIGFYADKPTSVSTNPVAAFSADGRTWTEVQSRPSGPHVEVSGDGRRLVAIDMLSASAGPRVWAGTQDGPVAWLRRQVSDAAFGGAVVTELVSDGEQFFAFGWDQLTEAPLVWIGDGLSWQREALPASFGGLPQMAAAGPTGVVVLGYRPTLRGDNPIIYRRTPTGRWVPEPQPLMAAVPDPSQDECPPRPSDYLAFSVLDLTTVPVCFGDSPITFRAWSAECQSCADVAGPSTAAPAWLMSATNQLFLSPIPVSSPFLVDGAREFRPNNLKPFASSVLVSPSVEIDDSLRGAWVELTGHFDDPAALTCHYDPPVDELQYWGGQRPIIDQCRQTFVVTDVVSVPPPLP